MTRTLFSLFALVAAIAVTSTSAFVPQSNMAFTPRTQPSLHMTVLTYNGKKKDFKAGSPLSNACKALGGTLSRLKQRANYRTALTLSLIDCSPGQVQLS
jgi:hypothetical protein